MRDTIRDKAYFLSVIERDYQRIDNFQVKMQNQQIATKQIPAVLEAIYRIKYNIWLAKYSMGESVNLLVPFYYEIVKDFFDNWTPDWYYDILCLLSIGVMLDADDEIFHEFSIKLNASNKNDFLYNFLIHSKIPHVDFKNSSNLFENPYGELVKIIIKNENMPNGLLTYLKKYWYQGHRDAGWYNSHRRNLNTYYGYWSFESGAIAKILRIDDSPLIDTQYYPYDLVHFLDK